MSHQAPLGFLAADPLTLLVVSNFPLAFTPLGVQLGPTESLSPLLQEL